METAITKGVKVSVKSKYESEYSNPSEDKYVFSYKVIIENLSDDPIQLLTRHWYILDSYLNQREVKGEGVIGEQPIIQPGKCHTYSSWSPLITELGKMFGTYEMQNRSNKEKFQVEIPAFKLIASYRYS
jgi:ApaG protein